MGFATFVTLVNRRSVVVSVPTVPTIVPMLQELGSQM